jgi:hypothetical protein
MAQARWGVVTAGIVSCLLIVLLLARYMSAFPIGMFLLPVALFSIPLLFISDGQIFPIQLLFVAVGGLAGCVAIPLVVYFDYSLFNSHLLGPIGLGMIFVVWPFIIAIFAGCAFFIGKICSSMLRV